MSKKKLRYLGLALSFAVLIAACAPEDDGAETDDLLEEVMERGTLRVALEAIYEPDSFLDESGNIIGFNPDVAEEIAERLGLEGVEYTEPSFSVIVAGNWQNRWDVAIHGITITEERLELLLYTQPYQYSDSMLAVHADNTTVNDSSTDLDGARIGVCAGCVQQRYLEKDLKLPAVEFDFVIDDADVRPYDNNLAASTDLALGDGVRLDAVLVTSSNLCSQIQDGAPVKYVPDRAVLFSEVNGLVFDVSSPKDSTRLRDEVDRIIGEMHADGTLSALSMKWNGWDNTKPGGFPAECA